MPEEVVGLLLGEAKDAAIVSGALKYLTHLGLTVQLMQGYKISAIGIVLLNDLKRVRSGGLLRASAAYRAALVELNGALRGWHDNWQQIIAIRASVERLRDARGSPLAWNRAERDITATPLVVVEWLSLLDFEVSARRLARKFRVPRSVMTRWLTVLREWGLVHYNTERRRYGISDVGRRLKWASRSPMMFDEELIREIVAFLASDITIERWRGFVYSKAERSGVRLLELLEFMPLKVGMVESRPWLAAQIRRLANANLIDRSLDRYVLSARGRELVPGYSKVSIAHDAIKWLSAKGREDAPSSTLETYYVTPTMILNFLEQRRDPVTVRRLAQRFNACRSVLMRWLLILEEWGVMMRDGKNNYAVTEVGRQVLGVLASEHARDTWLGGALARLLGDDITWQRWEEFVSAVAMHMNNQSMSLRGLLELLRMVPVNASVVHPGSPLSLRLLSLVDLGVIASATAGRYELTSIGKQIIENRRVAPVSYRGLLEIVLRGSRSGRLVSDEAVLLVMNGVEENVVVSALMYLEHLGLVERFVEGSRITEGMMIVMDRFEGFGQGETVETTAYRVAARALRQALDGWHDERRDVVALRKAMEQVWAVPGSPLVWQKRTRRSPASPGSVMSWMSQQQRAVSVKRMARKFGVPLVVMSKWLTVLRSWGLLEEEGRGAYRAEYYITDAGKRVIKELDASIADYRNDAVINNVNELLSSDIDEYSSGRSVEALVIRTGDTASARRVLEILRIREIELADIRHRALDYAILENLVDLGIVVREKASYRLTDKGRSFVELLNVRDEVAPSPLRDLLDKIAVVFDGTLTVIDRFSAELRDAVASVLEQVEVHRGEMSRMRSSAVIDVRYAARTTIRELLRFAAARGTEERFTVADLSMTAGIGRDLGASILKQLRGLKLVWRSGAEYTPSRWGVRLVALLDKHRNELPFVLRRQLSVVAGALAWDATRRNGPADSQVAAALAGLHELVSRK